jgi:hypothetical protein
MCGAFDVKIALSGHHDSDSALLTYKPPLGEVF